MTPPEELKPTCTTCRYWKRWKASSLTEGSCRRHPPVVLPSCETKFPHTYGDYWCGEHEAKEVQE